MSNRSIVPERGFLVGKWLQNWRKQFIRFVGFESYDQQQADHFAQDLGLSLSELYALEKKSSDADDLLSRRLKVFHIDQSELKHTQPVLLRDLERVCTTCESQARCTSDLADNPKSSAWLHYCPNAVVLRTLPRKLMGYLGFPVSQE